MGLIPAVKVWTTETLTDSDLNGAFAAIRNTVNASGLFTDVPRTVTATLTFSAPPVFSTGITVGGTLTVSTGGLVVTAGGGTITAGGLTVSAGGLTVTGNSTITGALSGLTTVTASGTVTGGTFSGSGASLTNLPAAQLTGTLPALSGANLTNLNASNIASGTINAARLPTIALATTATQLQVLTNTLAVDGSAGQFLTADNVASWHTLTAPAGSGTSRWLNVTIGGTAYRIECRTVA